MTLSAPSRQSGALCPLLLSVFNLTLKSQPTSIVRFPGGAVDGVIASAYYTVVGDVPVAHRAALHIPEAAAYGLDRIACQLLVGFCG